MNPKFLNKVLSLALILLLLPLSGCVDSSKEDVAEPGGSGNESLSGEGLINEQVSEEYIAGKAAVENVTIIMTRSIPPQVRAVAFGMLGGSCEKLDRENISVKREGKLILVDIPTLIQSGVPCTLNLVPFEEYVPIDIEGLEPGEYTVSVNGVNASFVLGDYAASSKTCGIIQGNILFESLETPVEDATVYIRLDDVSLADAPSTVIAETSIEGVSVGPEGKDSIPFTLVFQELVDNRTYSLYVHIDADGNGRVSKGDYVTTWHNDVPAGQEEVRLDVTVSPV
ncbi:hypothetical protein FTO70_15595 [Methanosarcina sp. KYL-1]|uniref:hypothetical protein n=1 Tax=Methanosarcina sp. KYL-1 TaxID=2602068 RepID=UPI002100A8EF|nr:hypothetical protein [Methanosarcina sp. KYL-1]MCQ1537069.1 hypothetical protein [Methanosarcina sp. KYL-1]